MKHQAVDSRRDHRFSNRRDRSRFASRQIGHFTLIHPNRDPDREGILACGLLQIGDGPAASPLASQRQPSWYLSKLPWPRWLQSWRGLFSCGLARSEPRLAPGNAASQSSAYTRSAARVTYGPS